MRYILSFLFFVVCFIAKSQEVMMDVKLEKDTIVSNKGANLKKFTHFYSSIGFAASSVEGDSLKVNYGRSNDLIFGIRHKLKISNVYAIGFDLYYSYRNNNIAQTNDKKFVTGLNHKKERYVERNVGLILYNRFNFGKRGNKIGKFVDLGAHIEAPIYNTLVTSDRISAVSYDQIKVVRKSLNFYNPFNYGVNFRAGINRWVLFANYRLSNGMKSKFNFAELPRLTAGIQIGWHQ